MANMLPYLCSKCGNWWTPVAPQHRAGFLDECRICGQNGEQEGDANAHVPRTHCHYGRKPATFSEIQMTKAVQTLAAVKRVSEVTVKTIAISKDQEDVDALLKRATEIYAEAKALYGKVPAAMQWAGVLEMPGKTDADNKTRFKDIEAIREMVNDNRRPISDLEVLERSIDRCGQLNKEVEPLWSEAEVAIARVRKAAAEWAPAKIEPIKPPVVEDKPKADPLAKARAAKAAKRAKAKEQELVTA